MGELWEALGELGEAMGELWEACIGFWIGLDSGKILVRFCKDSDGNLNGFFNDSVRILNWILWGLCKDSRMDSGMDSGRPL